MSFPNDAKNVRKATGYTEVAERVLSERSLAKFVSGAIGEGDIEKGEQLKVYVHELATVANYIPGTGVNLTGDNSDYVTVNNQEDIAVNEVLDGLTLKQAYNEPDYVAGRLEAAAEAIGERIDVDFFKLLQKDGTEAKTTEVTSSTVYKDILALKLNLDKAGAPANGRFLIVNPEAENALLGAANVVLNTKRGERILYDGFIGNFLGFNVFRTTRLPYDKDGYTQMVAMQARGTIFADGWKVEPALFELNDSTHVGDSKIGGRYAYNPGVIRDDLVQHITMETIKITLDLKGGKLNGEDSIEVIHAKGTLFPEPNILPIKTGKVFEGWIIKSGSEPTWASYKPTANVTLEAQWGEA